MLHLWICISSLDNYYIKTKIINIWIKAVLLIIILLSRGRGGITWLEAAAASVGVLSAQAEGAVVVLRDAGAAVGQELHETPASTEVHPELEQQLPIHEGALAGHWGRSKRQQNWTVMSPSTSGIICRITDILCWTYAALANWTDVLFWCSTATEHVTLVFPVWYLLHRSFRWGVILSLRVLLCKQFICRCILFSVYRYLPPAEHPCRPSQCRRNTLFMLLDALIPHFHQCGSGARIFPITELVLCISAGKKLALDQKIWLQHNTELGTLSGSRTGYTNCCIYKSNHKITIKSMVKKYPKTLHAPHP